MISYKNTIIFAKIQKPIMKILKLRFKNINSLKNEHIIEFDKPPLSDTGIFAIVGATGSGKSTILDAISLALYNRTPRTGSLSKTSIENHGSIITRNTFDCYSEIEYEIKGKKYRSKWEVHKAKKTGKPAQFRTLIIYNFSFIYFL